MLFHLKNCGSNHRKTKPAHIDWCLSLRETRGQGVTSLKVGQYKSPDSCDITSSYSFPSIVLLYVHTLMSLYLQIRTFVHLRACVVVLVYYHKLQMYHTMLVVHWSILYFKCVLSYNLIGSQQSCGIFTIFENQSYVEDFPWAVKYDSNNIEVSWWYELNGDRSEPPWTCTPWTLTPGTLYTPQTFTPRHLPPDSYPVGHIPPRTYTPHT